MNIYRRFLHLDRFLTDKLSSTTFTWRQIFHLLLPNILDSLSITFINMLIMALISKNGEESVAALSIVNPITGLVTCVFSAISAGGTVVVAQCSGKNDEELLKHAIGMTMWMTIAIGIVGCLPFILFPHGILDILYPQAEPLVMKKASIYLAGSVWSILVFSVYLAVFSVLRGLGKSQKCLILSVIINMAYFLFSLLFLNVLHMDIQGSVYALLLARITGTLVALGSFFLWNPPIRIKFRHLLSFHKTLFRSNVQVSLPLILEQACQGLGNVVSQVYMLPLGTTALATNSIANSLMGVLIAPAQASASLSVAVVGRCIGADKKDEAYSYGKRCNQIARILIILTSFIFFPTLSLLLRQYNPSQEVYTTTVHLILAETPFVILFWPMSVIMHSTLQAASDTVYPSIVSLATLWTVNIGIGFVLAIPCGLGLWGVWIAKWLAWITRTAAFLIRYRSKKWLTKSKLKNI